VLLPFDARLRPDLLAPADSAVLVGGFDASAPVVSRGGHWRSWRLLGWSPLSRAAARTR